MDAVDPTQDLWEYASSFLPVHLSELAESTGALRRCRGIDDARSLLRVLLCCALPGSSFRTASAWCSSAQFASITSEGLFYRMKISERFLAAVLGCMVLEWREVPALRRLVLVDATVLTGPGSSGTDFRIHAMYDPVRAVPLEFVLTDCHTGESLGNYDLRPGDLVLGDRGYGHFRGYSKALGKGADVLVRLTPGTMKLTDASGRRVLLEELDSQIPRTGGKSFLLDWYGPEGGDLPVRVIGVRARSGEVCWLATNLACQDLPDEAAASLYGYRWQIELLFKRLKSLLHLGDLRSREGPTAKAFIYAKLVTAALALRLSDSGEAFSPYGYRIQGISPQPVERVPVRAQRPRSRPARSRPLDEGRLVEAQATLRKTQA